MKLGKKLLELRKEKKLSQEEVAFELNVTRQTVSKWETDQSSPDFDKLIPLCNLYNITADELLNGKVKKEEKVEDISLPTNHKNIKVKKAIGISIGVFLYFIAVAWIMVAIPVMQLNPVFASAIFLIICGVATAIIIFVCIFYKKAKKKNVEERNPILKQINFIISVFFLIIYLLVSFITMAWHITWILWIVYALVTEIVKLIFMLKGDNYEE